MQQDGMTRHGLLTITPPGTRYIIAACLAWSALTFPRFLHAAEFVAPYVNTVEEDVTLMLDLAEVGPDDYLIDLGAGDGRIVIEAARRGARGHGVELDPDLVALAESRASKAGVSDRAAFRHGDIFAADISRATVVTAYLFPEANLQLRPKLLTELAPGSRVVSNAFDMGDWLPDARAYGRTSGGSMLWVVPARIHGTWTIDMDGRRFRLDLQQRYQALSARLLEGEQELDVLEARISGAAFSLMATNGDQRIAFNGSVGSDGISGSAVVESADVESAERSDRLEWHARRTGP
jgi:SAM-dependent methyltransferase